MRKILAAAIMAWSFSAPTMAQTNDINLNTSCHAVSALYNMGDMVGLNETITVIKSGSLAMTHCMFIPMAAILILRILLLGRLDVVSGKKRPPSKKRQKPAMPGLHQFSPNREHSGKAG